MPQNALNREQEIDRFIDLYGKDQPGKIMEAMERQFAILHNRSQVSLGLAGIIVTTTGFSGRLIAGTNILGQMLIIAGVTLSLLSAVVLVLGVLHLHWLTQQPGDLVRPWINTCLDYRDKKTNFYRVGAILLTVGIACYVAAIAVMLLNPGADALPPR